MGYPTFEVKSGLGYGMGYAKWDMQKEVSQAGQIGFGEVKWERPAWPVGTGIREACASLQDWSSINICSSPVPRSLSLPLPAPPAICPCFCCLSTTSTHPSAGPLNERLYGWPSTLLHGQDINSHTCIQLSHKVPTTNSIFFTTSLFLWTAVLL